MTPVTRDDIVLDTLTRLEGKVDHITERVVRVETLVDERTTKDRRREFLSRGTWTTVISGLIVGIWEVIKMKWLKP